MKNYNHAEVTRLLNEMEACVDRVRVLCAKMTASWEGANEIGYGEG